MADEEKVVDTNPAAADTKDGAADAPQAVNYEAMLADERDKYLRLLAEFDNYKKRTVREKQALAVSSVANVIEGILPICDNVEAAIGVMSGADERVLQGLRMIQRSFEDALSNIGVTPIPAVGTEFDPELHNAVAQEPVEGIQSGHVAEEYKRGYLYKDKVIRHSIVKVAE